MTDKRIVLTTASSEEEGRKIARSLVERRLAACVNVVPQVTSIYRWQGKVEEAREWLLIIKTTAAAFDELRQAIADLQVNRWVLMLLINVFLLICGLFVPPAGIILMTSPILLPIILHAGFDPVWFGVIVTINMEVGLITPPVGLNLFVLSTISSAPIGEVIRGILPFLILLLIVLVAVVIYVVLGPLLHVPYALALGILSGVLEIIPLVGPLIAAAFAGTVTFAAHGTNTTIVVLVVYLVVRQVEDQVVMPLVIGRAVHLHPVITIFAVLVGLSTWGVLGGLLGVPVAAAINVTLHELYPEETGGPVDDGGGHAGQSSGHAAAKTAVAGVGPETTVADSGPGPAVAEAGGSGGVEAFRTKASRL